MLPGMALFEEVADEIRERITSGEYPPRKRLPTERDLQVNLGCSRTTLRRALGRLDWEGLIEPKQGSGWYVREVRPKPVLDALAAIGRAQHLLAEAEKALRATS